MAKQVFQILIPESTSVSRIISCENKVTELYVIDRADKKFVSEYSSELNKPALYILINRDTKQLYVGETDDSLKRLHNHEAKDFWTEAIVFHSTTDTLSTTEVRWLEAKTYEVLNGLGYYDLSANKQVPQSPPLKKNQIYTLEPIFEEAKNYIRAAGFDIFLQKKEQASPAQTSDHQIFFCTRSGCDAKGYFVDDTHKPMVVLAGSKLRVGFRNAAKPDFIKRRQDFIAKYCDVKNGVPVLKQDYTFTSPSLASAILVGGPSDGWNTWHDENGKTIDELFRQKS